MSILFAGTPANAAESLKLLVQSGADISLVLTRTDAKVGRKGLLTPSPVAQVAAELGLPVIKANRYNAELGLQLAGKGIEFAIVIAYGALLPNTALSLLPKGWFNLHYSVLPAWRGAAPVQWALINGSKTTGVTLFKIDEGLDTGQVLNVAHTSIEPGEDAGRLLERLTTLGVSLVLESLPLLHSGVFELREQIGEVTLAPKLSKADGFTDFAEESSMVLNRILGVTPEPGAWTTLHGQVLKILEAKPASIADLSVGEVVIRDGSVLVGCSQGSLELVEVQPAGKNRMKATDWFRGLRADTVRLAAND